ncbi:MAG: chemotaxis protein CheW [Desulfobacterales bacterium]|nr:chemotaxis protein CheW [Desulfobacterales bacterium]
MGENTNTPADAGLSALGGKYLTFVLNAEEYGIDIHRIKEIIGMMDITTVPRTPDHIKGVINLRGKVIPVIDLRIRFSMPPEDYTDKTCIVVVELDQDGSTLLLGMVVDSVSEVLTVPGEAVGPPPAFGSAVTTDWIRGLAKMESGVKILLDIEAVVGDTNLTV